MTQHAALVCVTGQKTCQRLIHQGAQIATENGLPLLVLSVSGSGRNLLEDPMVSEALDFLYGLSGAAGAEMTMLHSTDVYEAIRDFIRERRVTHVILGASQQGSGGLIDRLMHDIHGVTFHIVPVAEDMP